MGTSSDKYAQSNDGDSPDEPAQNISAQESLEFYFWKYKKPFNATLDKRRQSDG